MQIIVPFTAYEPLRVDQAGSKAYALMTMTREGMLVPPGFVLTVQFFEPWIEILQATDAWADVVNSEVEELEESTKVLQAECANLEFTNEQQDALDRALDAFQASCPGNLFAVRSSSPEEDLEGASFAGGYETTLSVTPDSVEEAILHSFASSFDARVYLYKMEHGFSLDNPRIAVIVQQQIDADTAGVAFSLNPLNNCYDEAVINANWGLGESVVDGTADPDVFVVDKVRHKVIDTQIGNKESIVTLNPDGGTAKTSGISSAGPCLTYSQVLTLTDLLNQVETFYQKPVDIEWAFSEEKLYLLQVRPITTYLPLPDEMVTAPGSPKRLYADSTLIEQGVTEPLSILGLDFLGYILKQMSGPFGGDVTGLDGISFTAGGRYYMNLSNSIKMMGRNASLAPGSYGDEGVMAILDSIDLGQYLSQKLPGKLASSKRTMIFRMGPLLLPAMAAFVRPKAFLQKYLKALPGHLQRFESVLDESLSVKQQATNLTDLLQFFFLDYGLPMMLAPQIAQSRIKQIFKNESAQVQEHLASLGMSLPGNKTAKMGELLYQLAAFDAIKTNGSSEMFITALNQRSLDPEFLQAWDQFIAEFGARCPREIDVATPRPHEQSALLFDLLQNMAVSKPNSTGSQTIFESARSRREAAYHSLSELAAKKGKRKAKSLEKLYTVWVTLGGYRENGKHYVIKVIDLFRQRVLQIAETFVAEDRLDRADQIFDLKIDDIDLGINNASLDLRVLAEENTIFTNRIRKNHLVARVIDSRGKIFYPPRKDAKAGEFIGVPISPGIIQGTVKIMHSADEKQLLPGEILVARATDPGWTPLFINAGGIILEIGSALQHGAVVAREYGIPCVSGLDGVTDRLKDGQRVEVDGSNGVVRLLETD